MKRLRNNILVLVGAPFLLFAAKGHAQQSTTLPDFTRIKANGNVQIELHQADRHSIYIENNENAESMKAYVENGTLHIDGGLDPVIKIYFKMLSVLEVDGAVNVLGKDTITVNTLQIHGNGATHINMNVVAENLKVNADGACSVSLAGRSAIMNVDADGAASIKALDMPAKTITVSTDGAASARVNVTETLNAKANGTSSIRFAGEPQFRNISVDGLASVKSLKEGDEYTSMNDMTTEKDGDTTRVKLGNRRLIIIEDKEKDKKTEKQKEDEAYLKRRRMKRVWAGFELGVSGLTTPSMSFAFNDQYKFLNTQVGNSWFFGLNFFEVDGHLIRNKLALTTGLGIVWNNLHFDGNSYLTPKSDTLSATASTSNLSLNKLYTFDITAPLLIKFAPGNRRHSKAGFHIATGVIVHYIPTKRVVTETSEGGYKHREEYNDDFNINAFRVDGTVRIGYDRIKLFANYSLTPYFNNNKAPDVRLFAAGITLVGF